MRTLAVLFTVTAVTMAYGDDNILVNGDFSRADPKDAKQPLGWSKPDGITSKWDAERKLVVLDTRVLQKDKKTFKENPEAVGGDNKGGQYSTVGAHEGAWLYSRPIKIEKADEYFIIEGDIRGPKSSDLFYPKILLRGYRIHDPEKKGNHSSYMHKHFDDLPAFSEQFGDDKKEHRAVQKGEYLMNWRSTVHCRLKDENKWQHFQLAFQFKSKRFHPDVLIVKPYAYWPAGAYEFDNIVVRRTTKAEYDDMKKARH